MKNKSCTPWKLQDFKEQINELEDEKTIATKLNICTKIILPPTRLNRSPCPLPLPIPIPPPHTNSYHMSGGFPGSARVRSSMPFNT